MSDLNIHDICWYSGGEPRLVSEGRIVHIVGNGGPEDKWARPFRRGQLYFVFSGTPLSRTLRIMEGLHSAHAVWVHPRHLRLMEGICVECGNLKLATDYMCIKCRSRG